MTGSKGSITSATTVAYDQHSEVEHARESRAHRCVRHAGLLLGLAEGRGDRRLVLVTRTARQSATCRRSGSTTPGAAAARRGRHPAPAARRRRSAPSTAPPTGRPPTRRPDRAGPTGGAAHRVRGARSSPLQPFTCTPRGPRASVIRRTSMPQGDEPATRVATGISGPTTAGSAGPRDADRPATRSTG